MTAKTIITKKDLWFSRRLITSKGGIVAKMVADIAPTDLKKWSDIFFFPKKWVLLHSILGINHFFIENIQ